MGPASTEEQESFVRSNAADRVIVVPWWFYPITAIILGAAIVALALLPRQIAGPSLVAAALLATATDRIAARVSGTRLRLRIPANTAGVWYAAVLGIVVIGSLIVVSTVVRPGGPSWLAWVLAALVFVVALSGTWVAKTERAV